MKIALAIICKPDDIEAEYLYQCLGNTTPYVDGIFVTITGKNKEVEQVCDDFGVNVSHFEWCNDFSKARNFNFAQVPQEYEYILWVDADDMIRGLENLKPTIEENPSVDIFSMFYLYSFDKWRNPVVSHQKSRVIRNDGCVKWVGALHEDFSETRNLEIKFLKDVEVLHMADDDKFEQAKKRNLVVSKHQMKELPDDPRSYWNVGNSQKALGKNKEAVKTFKKFLKLSQSDDEKYIVRLRMAEASMDDLNEALEQVRYAIGIKPEYPDAYHLMGTIYFEMELFKKAAECYVQCLTKKPPYYKIIVFNPRDYDSTPLMNLAKCYFNMSRPDLAVICLEQYLLICPKDEDTKILIKRIRKEKEKFDNVLPLLKQLEGLKGDKLKKALDKIPIEFQSYPSICHIRNTNFVKKESSGKDLVFYCGFTEEDWTPDSLEKGIGGSEEAIIHLSQRLADKGWNVTVYNKCGHKELKFGKVTYKPFWSWNYRDKQDVVVLWRSPKAADYEINADKIIVDVHDMISPGEFNEKRMKRIDKVLVKSNFHKSVYDLPDDKIEVIPNGINTEAFCEDGERDDMLIINTSSPDRGLSSAIKIFKEVKKQVPKAKMKWAYGWGVFDVVYGENVEVMGWKKNIIKEMEEAGIENLGRISHEEVAELYKEANVFLYPSGFAEIDCISLTKAMASGAIPVTSDFAAMGDKDGHGGFFIHTDKTLDNWCEDNQYDYSVTDKQYIEKTVQLLKNPPEDRDIMQDWALRNFDWKLITNQWENEIQNN